MNIFNAGASMNKKWLFWNTTALFLLFLPATCLSLLSIKLYFLWRRNIAFLRCAAFKFLSRLSFGHLINKDSCFPPICVLEEFEVSHRFSPNCSKSSLFLQSSAKERLISPKAQAVNICWAQMKCRFSRRLQRNVNWNHMKWMSSLTLMKIPGKLL